MRLSPAKENTFFIQGPVGRLEVRQVEPTVDGPLASAGLCAVVCHPNPTRGGDMNNKVVTTLLRAYRDLGIAAVTFNFRGVGESEGEFDRGEGEKDDLRAVINWCRAHFAPQKLLLAGFSFGSSIAAGVSHECADLVHLLLVAPPVDRYLYEREGGFICSVCLVQGDQDELIPSSQVYQWAQGLETPLKLIRYEQASHFFHGFLTNLKTDVSAVLIDELA